MVIGGPRRLSTRAVPGAAPRAQSLSFNPITDFPLDLYRA